MGNKVVKASQPQASAPQREEPKAETQGASSAPGHPPAVPASDPERGQQRETMPVATKTRAIDPEMLLGERMKTTEMETEGATPEHGERQIKEATETPQVTSETAPDVLEETKQETIEAPPVVADDSQRIGQSKKKETPEVTPVTPEVFVEITEESEKEVAEAPAVTTEVKCEPEPLVISEEAESKKAAKGVVMPALDLEKLQNVPPEPERVEEDDPNLMAPPPLLTDAISSLKDTERPGSMTVSRPVESHGSEGEVLLAAPIVHDEIVLVEPTPVNEPIAEPPHRDDISIDEQVPAISEELPAEQLKASAPEDIAFTSTGDHTTLGNVPEDAVSLTSSVARGEDELLKNIMGVSTTMPTLTSNESVRGSVAVSEMTFDETQWECMRRADSSEKPPMLLLVTLDVSANGFITVCFSYEEEVKPSTAEEKTDTSAAVADVVDSIFEKVGQQKDEPKPVEKVNEEPVNLPESKAEDKTITAEPVEEAVCPQPAAEACTKTASETVTKPVPEPAKPEAKEHVVKPTESPVSVDLTEESGNVKVTLESGEELASKPVATALHPTHSEVSDKQYSVELDSPFVHVSESTELSETSPEVKEDKEKSTSTEEAKNLKTSKSKKKKTKSGEMHSPSSGLKTSTSDGTASVDSTGSGTPKPKPRPGRRESGRARGRGRGRGSVAGR